MLYQNQLKRLRKAPPILADYPQFVEPLPCEDRYQAPPLVNEPNGKLNVRSWRYWYNVRGIVEMENRLDAGATALVMVHPWGIDDRHGMRTPEPAGVAFFCTERKNQIGHRHVRQVVNPLFRRLRKAMGVVGYSLPGVEDPIRKLLYASIQTPPDALNPREGEKRLTEKLGAHAFTGQLLVDHLTLDDTHPVKSYFDQTPSTDAGDHYNGSGYWQLPMPLDRHVDYHKTDLVFYDAEGYPKVRDFLKSRGIRHILLTGYCTDMCVISTTCGYENFSKDFNVFVVGDATLATFPGSRTPVFATQVALANAALTQMITQASWVRLDVGTRNQ